MSPAVRRVRERIGAAVMGVAGDDGNAIVEFLGVALLLLVPVVYLALTLGRLQAATFAVDGAAREAVRAVVTAPDAGSADRQVVAAVGLALADQGVDAAPATTVTCDGDCLAPGATVTVQVSAEVPLPGTGWLQGAVPLSVPVTATATAVRDSWVAAGEAGEAGP